MQNGVSAADRLLPGHLHEGNRSLSWQCVTSADKSLSRKRLGT